MPFGVIRTFVRSRAECRVVRNPWAVMGLVMVYAITIYNHRVTGRIRKSSTFIVKTWSRHFVVDIDLLLLKSFANRAQKSRMPREAIPNRHPVISHVQRKVSFVTAGPLK